MARVAPSGEAPKRTIVVRKAPAGHLIRSLPPASVTLLLTDPPYDTVDRHGTHLKRWFRGTLTWAQIAEVLRLTRSRLTPRGLAMVVVNEAGLPHARKALERGGFTALRQIVWDQGRPGLGQGLRHQVGYVVVGRLPSSRSLNGVDLVRAAAVGSNAKARYPTEKPVQLGRELAEIAGIRRGETVVDPFCGSGALLIGSLERGARVIGGDTSARAVTIARRRLAAVARTQGAPAATRKVPATARGRSPLDRLQIFGTRRRTKPKPAPKPTKRARKR